MSKRFHKPFISAREFVESWDKEVYELTKLDYFIYLMINYLANQLEKRFFIRSRKNSCLYLSNEHIGTLCFNLGDSFECFVEEADFTGDRLDSMLGLDSVAPPLPRKGKQPVQQRLNSLRSFLSDGLIKEKNFRIELMDNVILDTLLQFYFEEMGVEIDEDDFEIIELADFVEDILVDYIRHEGNALLDRPGDSAIDHFEDLLGKEEEGQEEKGWEPADGFQSDEEADAWKRPFEDLTFVIQKFTDDRACNTADVAEFIAADIELLQSYLTDSAGLVNLYDFADEHLLEFMSVWLVRNSAEVEVERFPRIFQTMARFISWLANNYPVDYKKKFFVCYERVKTEVPRVVRALNEYLDEYSLFEIIELRDNPQFNQINGFYEVQRSDASACGRLNLTDIHFMERLPDVHLPVRMASRLKNGDIVQATLVQKEDRWEVLEIHFIFPQIAKRFVD